MWCNYDGMKACWLTGSGGGGGGGEDHVAPPAGLFTHPLQWHHHPPPHPHPAHLPPAAHSTNRIPHHHHVGEYNSCCHCHYITQSYCNCALWSWYMYIVITYKQSWPVITWSSHSSLSHPAACCVCVQQVVSLFTLNVCHCRHSPATTRFQHPLR